MAIFKVESSDVFNISEVKSELEKFTSQSLAEKFVEYETDQNLKIQNLEQRLDTSSEAFAECINMHDKRLDALVEGRSQHLRILSGHSERMAKLEKQNLLIKILMLGWAMVSVIALIK